jgi:alkyl hydroperoxide reductase subunit D
MADFSSLDLLFENKTTTVARDLKLNLKRFLSESALTPEEGVLAALACATSVEYPALQLWAKETLLTLGFSSEQIQEASETAAIMGMLNMYYRFRHFISHGEHGNTTDYQQAGLRMTSLAKPILGKDKFEMLAFAVSVLNGCESCVRAHELALKDVNVSVDKIHDLARLAATIKGLKALSLA